MEDISVTVDVGRALDVALVLLAVDAAEGVERAAQSVGLGRRHSALACDAANGERLRLSVDGVVHHQGVAEERNRTQPNR